MSEHQNINDALEILVALGFPRAQQNERSALCLLALANVTPDKPWRQADNPLIGITPIMEFSRDHYGAAYKPNTRETFRRQTALVGCGEARTASIANDAVRASPHPTVYLKRNGVAYRATCSFCGLHPTELHYG